MVGNSYLHVPAALTLVPIDYGAGGASEPVWAVGERRMLSLLDGVKKEKPFAPTGNRIHISQSSNL